jgi:transcriptional regulator with XRE-family HTH domain
MVTLQEYLDARGETQAQFGRRAGVRQQVVSRWASGCAIPRPHFIAAVERLTGRQVQAADFYMAHAARKHAMEVGQRAGEVAAKARAEVLEAGATRAEADREAEHAGMDAAAAAEDAAYRDHLKRARTTALRAAAKAERHAQSLEAAAAA